MEFTIASCADDIKVYLQSPVRLLEKGFARAIEKANVHFGINEYGHSTKVEDWERSDCHIEVHIECIQYCGDSYVLEFGAKAVKCIDEEDDIYKPCCIKKLPDPNLWMEWTTLQRKVWRRYFADVRDNRPAGMNILFCCSACDYPSIPYQDGCPACGLGSSEEKEEAKDGE